MKKNQKNIFNKSLLIIAVLVSSLNGFGQNWTGNLNSDWNNPANWSSWPLNGNDLLIDPINYTGAAADPQINAQSVFNPAGIIVQNGASLTIANNLSTTGDIEVLGAGSSLIMSAGTLDVAPANAGRLILDLGAEMVINGGSVNIGQRFIVATLSSVTMNSGSINTSQRLILDLGGSFVLNGGLVSVGQTLALADGELNTSCRFTVNGGTLNVGVELALECEAGNFSPEFIVNGGTLNINGDVSWFGELPGSGSPVFDLRGGVSTIYGTITNLAGSTVNLKLKVSGSSQVYMHGNLIETIQSTDSIIQSGDSYLYIMNSLTWNNAGVVFSTDGNISMNSGVTLQGTGSYQFHDIMILQNGLLNHVFPSEIFISGIIRMDGAFNPGLNKIVLNGSSEQSITGNAPFFSFYGLELNNTSAEGITLFRNIAVTSSLELTNGKLNTDFISLIHLSDNAVSTEGSAISFVNGPMSKTGDDPFVFPIGKNNKWRRLAISAPVDVTTNFIAEYFDESFTDLTPVSSPLTAVSSIEYWDLQRTVTNDQVSVTFYWEDASASAFTNCGNISIAKWNNSDWNIIPSSSSGVCTGSGSGYLESTLPIEPDGIFTFGFTADVYNLSFTICSGDAIVVNNNIYNSNGIYIDFMTAADNSDSTVITHLNVIPPINPVNYINICAGSTYAVGSSNYTTSGIYTDVLVSESGCDSTIETHLNVIEPVDSILNLTLCQGEFVSVGASIYYLTGIYSDTLSSFTGCDSIVQTNLFILDTIDVSLSQVSVTLHANSGYGGYQWIDCSTGFFITGETNPDFTPSQNGTYAVIIYDGSCSDTSECILVNTIGVDEVPDDSPIIIYPNPIGNSDYLTISGLTGAQSIRVLDMNGKLIYSLNTVNSSVVLNVFSALENGVYMIEIISDDMVTRRKVVKS
jgi:hypothetical protein